MATHKSLTEFLKLFGGTHKQSYYITSGIFSNILPEETFRADFYVICLCLSGEIHLNVNAIELVVSKNQIFVAAPSTVIGFSESQEQFEMQLLLFERNFVTKNSSNPYFIESMGIFKDDPYNLLEASEKNNIRLNRIMVYLESQSQRKGKFAEAIIITIIVNLLLEIAEIANEKQQTIKKIAHKTVYVDFMEMVHKHALTHKEVSFYADKLHITGKYLLRMIKKASGSTPRQIIDQSVLKSAYVLLADTRNDISQVAFETGFNSVSAFSRFFKRQTGISPSEYRARLIIS